MKNMALMAAVILMAGSAGNLARAQAPCAKIVGHPDLKEACEMIGHVQEKIDVAEKANNGKFGGHAIKAKELLRSAEIEVAEASMATK
jgi:hypothetical protein